MEGGGGLIEENDIYENERAGIGVETGAAPTIRKNRVFGGKEAGVFFFDGGMGLFEENEVWHNQDAGVQIIEASGVCLHSTCRGAGMLPSRAHDKACACGGRPDRPQEFAEEASAAGWR